MPKNGPWPTLTAHSHILTPVKLEKLKANPKRISVGGQKTKGKKKALFGPLNAQKRSSYLSPIHLQVGKSVDYRAGAKVNISLSNERRYRFNLSTGSFFDFTIQTVFGSPADGTSMLKKGGAFGGNRGLRPVPPEKGVFPLDHMHECDLEKKDYLNCLKSSGHQSEKCRNFSRKYLECRMAKNLMAKQDISELGFRKESDLDASCDNSTGRIRI